MKDYSTSYYYDIIDDAARWLNEEYEDARKRMMRVIGAMPIRYHTVKVGVCRVARVKASHPP